METYNQFLTSLVRTITRKHVTAAERKTLLQNFAKQINDLRGKTNDHFVI
jgi:hypothetical protein